MRIETGFLPGKLHERQFGFRRNPSTVDALRDVMEYIAESEKRGEYTCLLTSDINIAFKIVRRADVIRTLEDEGVDPYLLELIEDYLYTHSVFIHQGEYFFNVRVPQGSCLGLFSD